jgi:CheY-like chemotaxis protein
VAVTGFGQPADKDRALRAGFDRHLVKPVDLKTLIRVIDELRSDATA